MAGVKLVLSSCGGNARRDCLQTSTSVVVSPRRSPTVVFFFNVRVHAASSSHHPHGAACDGGRDATAWLPWVRGGGAGGSPWCVLVTAARAWFPVFLLTRMLPVRGDRRAPALVRVLCPNACISPF